MIKQGSTAWGCSPPVLLLHVISAGGLLTLCLLLHIIEYYCVNITSLLHHFLFHYWAYNVITHGSERVATQGQNMSEAGSLGGSGPPNRPRPGQAGQLRSHDGVVIRAPDLLAQEFTAAHEAWRVILKVRVGSQFGQSIRWCTSGGGP